MKSLFDVFNEKFEENTKNISLRKAAFIKTNEDMGFQAFKNYNSFSTIRKRKRKH